MTDAVPAFVTAAAHPLRWRLLTELAHGDLAVHELAARAGEPHNLISYHLGKLRKAELVTAKRSSADGRDSYYRLDLARAGTLLADAGAALHPALRVAGFSAPAPRGRVLFLCTGNSARSQIAEALLRECTAGAVEAHSAGSRPKPVHPHAVTVLAARGIDITAARSKHVDEFAGQHFDRVITLCDRVKEVCPDFPGRVHWSVPEPADLPAFESVADELAERIEFLLHTLAAS